MRILYHFRVRGTGAEGVHIAGIACAFRALGHTVRFISPSGVDPTAATALAGAPRREAPRRGLAVRLLHLLADRAPQALFELMEMAYNLVALPRLLVGALLSHADFLYERYAFFNISGAVASALLHKPLLVEVNELAGYERVRGQCFVRLARAAERFIFRRAALVVTVSDFLRERVRRMAGDGVPVVTIPNGVSPEWLLQPPRDPDALRARLGLQGRRVICFIGGLVHWHNFGLLLEALGELRQHAPDATLLIVGEGPLRAEIERQAAELGLGGAVVLVGRVPHDEIIDYIALSDATVIPQSNEYRSPIKLFEYMAIGKPVVAPHTQPIDAVLEDGRSGFLFEPGDRHGLAAALERALLDPEQARRVGSSARREIARRYTWDAHAGRILSLLAERRASRWPGDMGPGPRPFLKAT